MIITIARQTGCGALHVGEKLARHYGIPFYTRQNLRDMAERKGMLSEMDDFFEERPVDELMFAISSDYEDSTGKKNERPLEMLAEMIGDENCIIIGRCGNYIFRKRQDLVSVFLKGNIHQRIRNIEADEHLPYIEAKDFVQEQDDHRQTYHKFHTGLTWGNADDYDLCVDSCRLSVDDTAQLIIDYVDHTECKVHQFE
ncbi:MAG: cytidylate kinase-like family protein [Prevotella sp.]|nr:cytidylate kinase-like family protein [Prevotella sp.]